MTAPNATLPSPEVPSEKIDIVHPLDLDLPSSNYTEDPTDPEEVKAVKRRIH
jgi:hypothetical protein